MTNLTLAVPDEIKKKMDTFPEMNWSEVARQAFKQKIEDMEFLRRFKEKSKLSEANVLFSALIRDSLACDLIFSGLFHPFTPEYICTELEEHKEEILEKTEKTSEEFSRILDILKRRISIIP